MVQEDPEDFLGNVGDFLVPEFVWTRNVHAQDECHGSFGFCLCRLRQVGQDLACSVFEFAGCRLDWGGKIGDCELLLVNDQE